MNDRHFANFHIAGFTYYDGVDVFYELRIGTKLILKAEPTNQFDAYAVAIYYNDTKLGYVPREKNKEISKFL
ncbi:MAG: HIRAN domain-containing protein, partial [Prevotellaceae bacterium]|nr:HIRAN domain-containing protein [Prevotellaceae bacterium]